MNATQAGEIHAKRRSIERFGIRLSARTIQRIICDIRGNRAIPLKKQSHSRTIFAVRMERHEEWLPVVYSRARRTIVTVLPESALEQYKNEAGATQADPPAPAPKARKPRSIPPTPQWRMKIDAPHGCKMVLTLGFFDTKIQIGVLFRPDEHGKLRSVEYGRMIRTRWAAADQMIRDIIRQKMQGPRGIHRSEELYAQATSMIAYALRAKGIQLDDEPATLELPAALAA